MHEILADIPWGWAFFALVPLVLVLVTSFLKISVVLSFLRNALGTPDVPPGSAIVAVSILLSIFVMGPVALEMQRAAMPLLEEIQAGESPSPQRTVDMAAEIGAPLHTWLTTHSGEGERELFLDLAHQRYAEQDRAQITAGSWLVVVPAFVLTELKEAFLIGFVLYVPFLVLELAIAGILLSMNMQSMNPSQVSLPFKLLLFVLIDGWTLLIEGLILGYG